MDQTSPDGVKEFRIGKGTKPLRARGLAGFLLPHEQFSIHRVNGGSDLLKLMIHTGDYRRSMARGWESVALAARNVVVLGVARLAMALMKRRGYIDLPAPGIVGPI